LIHRIYSTLPTFKTLSDFQQGLNVLLAEKTIASTQKQTRNRAGKSSFIEIINFLTGANVEPNSIFRTKELVGYSFGMEFDLKKINIGVERGGGQKSKINLIMDSPTQITHTKWTEILGEEMFGLSSLKKSGYHPPTFRSLFSYFVRRQASEAFIKPEKSANKQQIDDMQISLMFLLGLDWEIARDWQVIRDKEKTLAKITKAEADGMFSDIIGKTADLRTKLTIEEFQLKKISEELSNFQILPMYRELESELNDLTKKFNELANENSIDASSINDIESSLASETPPNLEDLHAIYKEAGIIFPELVKRCYENLKIFHESVIRNRKDYLTSEFEEAKMRMQLRDKQKLQYDKRRIEIMTILKSHGALDQFTLLQKETARLESKVSLTRQRFESAEKLEGGKSELEIERNQLLLRLRHSFAEQKEQLSEAILAFEETSKRLYESAGSMNIVATTNGPLFSFPMQGSRSKGIKNIQIFCFDMMLMRLCTKRGIGPGFLVHDSHLFDGVDGRQVISALRVGSEVAKELGFQYIVTMNEDDAYKEKEVDFDLKQYVLSTRLTDATEDGGLFGIRFS